MNTYFNDNIYDEIYQRSLDISYHLSKIFLSHNEELILLISQEDFDELKEQIKDKLVLLIEVDKEIKMEFANGLLFNIYIVDISRFRVLNKVS